MICDAVNRYGRIWQTGSWQRSEDHFRRACELVINGRIGKVTRVEVGLPDGGDGPDAQLLPVPESLDWDRWLGPAPYRPYQYFLPIARAASIGIGAGSWTTPAGN